MGKKQRSIGIIMEDDRPVLECMKYARVLGYDYICRRVVNPKKTKQLMESDTEFLSEPFAFNDLDLTSQDRSRAFVGILSNLNPELASTNLQVRQKANKLIRQEMDYCKHINAPVTMLEPDTLCVSNTSEIVNSKLLEYIAQGIWVRVPILVKRDKLEPSFWPGIGEGDWDSDKASGWYTWTAFHAECEYSKCVTVALELTADVPDDDDIARWMGEPVKCIIIPTNIFITNAKGFPVLTKAHQKLFRQLATTAYQVVIEPSSRVTDDCKYHRQYINEILRKLDEDLGENPWVEGYEDFLQSPLQPLMHNLESEIYEVFEKDPVKYVLYENAIAAAIMSKQPEPTTEKLVVMVLGAGRGPIVRAAIRASQSTGRDIFLYALEKNRNAVNTLLHLRDTEWKESGVNVTVVHSDMRKWNPNVKADIIVSELLGSFGDNELSPECLDGAQRFLDSEGIMIPTSYTSYIHPIMSSKMFTAVGSVPEPKKSAKGESCLYQTPYVVHMKNKFDIADPQEVFTFSHPKRDLASSNDRSKELEFVATADSMLSGFAGYFESDLFGGILMSILPSSYTENMFSWFPIYFPIKQQVPVKKGDKIRLRFRRCSNERSVWYEWSITSPTFISTHNLNGSAYEIGL